MRRISNTSSRGFRRSAIVGSVADDLLDTMVAIIEETFAAFATRIQPHLMAVDRLRILSQVTGTRCAAQDANTQYFSSDNLRLRPSLD